MGELGLEVSRKEALAAAKTAINNFVGAEIKPEATTFDLMQDFGYGVRAADAITKKGKLGESQAAQMGNRPPGSHWTVTYETEWPGVTIEEDFFKSPRDEFNVQSGGIRLRRAKEATEGG